MKDQHSFFFHTHSGGGISCVVASAYLYYTFWSLLCVHGFPSTGAICMHEHRVTKRKRAKWAVKGGSKFQRVLEKNDEEWWRELRLQRKCLQCRTLLQYHSEPSLYCWSGQYSYCHHHFCYYSATVLLLLAAAMTTTVAIATTSPPLDQRIRVLLLPLLPHAMTLASRTEDCDALGYASYTSTPERQGAKLFFPHCSKILLICGKLPLS